MALITLKEYAERCGRSLVTVRQKMYRGGLKTVRKIGRQYFIDENEPYIDERVISGKYVGFVSLFVKCPCELNHGLVWSVDMNSL